MACGITRDTLEQIFQAHHHRQLALPPGKWCQLMEQTGQGDLLIDEFKGRMCDVASAIQIGRVMKQAASARWVFKSQKDGYEYLVLGGDSIKGHRAEYCFARQLNGHGFGK